MNHIRLVVIEDHASPHRIMKTQVFKEDGSSDAISGLLFDSKLSTHITNSENERLTSIDAICEGIRACEGSMILFLDLDLGLTSGTTRAAVRRLTELMAGYDFTGENESQIDSLPIAITAIKQTNLKNLLVVLATKHGNSRESSEPFLKNLLDNKKPTLTLGDIRNPLCLARKLAMPQDAVSIWLSNNLSNRTKELLVQWLSEPENDNGLLKQWVHSQNTENLLTSLINDLNNLIASEKFIYDEQGLKGLYSSQELEQLLSEELSSETLWLNRRLLEDAFPLEIGRGLRDRKIEIFSSTKSLSSAMALSQGATYVIPILEEAKTEFESKFQVTDSITPPSPIHECSEIASALAFYGKPWEQNWEPPFWSHDLLQKRDSKQYVELMNWLGDTVNNTFDFEQAKALVLWNDQTKPWQDLNELRSRYLTIQVIRAACSKLSITLECNENENAKFIPPCVPMFPFLIALRAFIWKKEISGEAVRKVNLSFYKGPTGMTHVLSLKLANLGGTKNGYRLWEKYCKLNDEVDRDDEPALEAARITPRLLRLLSYARTPFLRDPSSATGNSYLTLFLKGTQLQDGPSVPVVSLDFDQEHIYLLWTSEEPSE